MLETITKGVVFKAQKVIIYGPEGIGKTTFASKFPEPLFIDTEGSTNLLSVARFPKPSSWQMLIEQIKAVWKNPTVCKTLVIDTIDWAEKLCVDSVCAAHGKKGIEAFGYGTGYVHVAEEFGKFLNLLQEIIDKDINVVLSAHAQIRKFEQPDEVGSYDRYELKLGKKTSSQTAPLVKEWSDMVLFANYKVKVTEIDKKKKAQGGLRVMYTAHHPSWDAKNRHDLSFELPFDYAQIAHCIPNDPSATTKNVPSIVTTIQETISTPVEIGTESLQTPTVSEQPVVNHRQAVDEVLEMMGTKAPDPLAEVLKISKPLYDLMKANNITVMEIQEAVAVKGIFPKDMPLSKYPPDFIEQALISTWDRVYALIVDLRNVPIK